MTDRNAYMRGYNCGRRFHRPRESGADYLTGYNAGIAAHARWQSMIDAERRQQPQEYRRGFLAGVRFAKKKWVTQQI